MHTIITCEGVDDYDLTLRTVSFSIKHERITLNFPPFVHISKVEGTYVEKLLGNACLWFLVLITCILFRLLMPSYEYSIIIAYPVMILGKVAHLLSLDDLADQIATCD